MRYLREEVDGDVTMYTLGAVFRNSIEALSLMETLNSVWEQRDRDYIFTARKYCQNLTHFGP